MVTLTPLPDVEDKAEHVVRGDDNDQDLGDEEVDVTRYDQTGPRLDRNAVDVDSLLNEGTVIDVDTEKEEAEKRVAEEAGEATWWSKDQLVKHMNVNFLEDIFGNNSESAISLDFSEIKRAEDWEILDIPDKAEDGRPLIHKKMKQKGFGPFVTPNSSITYHYEAYLDMSSDPFDSTILRHRPCLSRLNVELLVPGLFYGLNSMRVGEKSAFLVDPMLAFGEIGCPPRIPPSAEILYVVHVLKMFVEGTLGDYMTMNTEEQAQVPFIKVIEMADTERKSGNGYFVEGRKKEAGIRYQRAIRVLETRTVVSEEEEKILNELLLKLYCNAANTSVSLGRPLAAITFARQALKIDRDSCKGHYFLGKALINAGDYEEARRHLTKANSLKPGNAEVAAELARLNRRLEHERKTSKELAQKMGQLFVSENKK